MWPLLLSASLVANDPVEVFMKGDNVTGDSRFFYCFRIPQLLTLSSVRLVLQLFSRHPTGRWAAYFNSWSAGASVNHLHWHIVQAELPLFRSPELRALVALGSPGPLPCPGWPARPLVWPVFEPAGLEMMHMITDR